MRVCVRNWVPAGGDGIKTKLDSKCLFLEVRSSLSLLPTFSCHISLNFSLVYFYSQPSWSWRQTLASVLYTPRRLFQRVCRNVAWFCLTGPSVRSQAMEKIQNVSMWDMLIVWWCMYLGWNCGRCWTSPGQPAQRHCELIQKCFWKRMGSTLNKHTTSAQFLQSIPSASREVTCDCGLKSAASQKFCRDAPWLPTCCALVTLEAWTMPAR